MSDPEEIDLAQLAKGLTESRLRFSRMMAEARVVARNPNAPEATLRSLLLEVIDLAEDEKQGRSRALEALVEQWEVHETMMEGDEAVKINCDALVSMGYALSYKLGVGQYYLRPREVPRRRGGGWLRLRPCPRLLERAH